MLSPQDHYNRTTFSGCNEYPCSTQEARQESSVARPKMTFPSRSGRYGLTARLVLGRFAFTQRDPLEPGLLVHVFGLQSVRPAQWDERESGEAIPRGLSIILPGIVVHGTESFSAKTSLRGSQACLAHFGL